MLAFNKRSKSVLLLSGSPSVSSKTARTCDFVCDWLAARDHDATHLKVRDLPAEALLSGKVDDSAVRDAIEMVANADGLILATPTFKASFSGLLKALLDILPQFAFRDKVVMPLATGGSLAHVLALDYGLRPVVQSMRPRIIVPSVFLLDKDILIDGGDMTIDSKSSAYLFEILAEFENALEGTAAADEVARIGAHPLHSLA